MIYASHQVKRQAQAWSTQAKRSLFKVIGNRFTLGEDIYSTQPSYL